ncbi:LOW QUALITY PROTEIN: olfactory receptor 1D2-like [Etheostoma spectabile]|uniref:LOW QUALITY PROTEIN: olfactory receptor 1D2-like n=1 Tax=Etheostoma spectabile TaxID=54343 RepID=UPI0013AF37EC|nr:LOW QUALITY PROTEIN: olfactory receptor 1D2-like [Etheostoma spectabile]
MSYLIKDNVSVARFFILSGLNETKDYREILFTFTLLYYCVILFANISVITIIILDRNLHEPMYILLCSFFINGLYGTAGFYPKFLSDLLSSSQQISYEGCLSQAFVMYSFVCCDFSILAVMSYDTYVATCQPLHYLCIMTKKRLSQPICFSWVTPFCILSINVLLTSRLTLCGTNIARVLRVNWIIIKLACSDADTFLNNVAAYFTIVVYVSHGLFTIWTYRHLIRTSVRAKGARKKFMQTCVPHLVSLVTFTALIVCDLMYMRFGSLHLPQSLQNVIAIEFLLIPPIMNPLIYGYKLTKIRNRIVGLVYFKRK